MKYVLKNVNVLDGTLGMEVQENMNILIEDKKIMKITKEDIDIDEVVDLEGKYIIPGLINLHVHLPGGGKPGQTNSNLPKLIQILSKTFFGRQLMVSLTKKSAKIQLLSGVTTIRTVGGLINADTKVRSLIQKKKAIGPRIIASDNAISVEGGHMAGSVALVAHNDKEARQLVNQIAVNGVDVIKLMITGGVLDADDEGTPGALKMAPEIVRAACEEASRIGLEVAAHVESSEGIRVALENGVHTIEHGSYLDDELIALFKEKNAVLVTTLSPVVPMLFDQSQTGMDDLYIKMGKIVMDGMIDGAKKAIENHIPLGCGTDCGCPYITQYDTWRELEYLVHYLDVTPEFALYTATLSNATIVHLENLIGSIEEGKIADLVVCDSNPLTGFDTLKQPYMVIHEGERYEHPQVERNQEYDQLFEGVRKSWSL